MPISYLKAEGRGICHRCQGVINAGDEFVWEGDKPAHVICRSCKERMSEMARLDRACKARSK